MRILYILQVLDFFLFCFVFVFCFTFVIYFIFFSLIFLFLYQFFQLGQLFSTPTALVTHIVQSAGSSYEFCNEALVQANLAANPGL